MSQWSLVVVYSILLPALSFIGYCCRYRRHPGQLTISFRGYLISTAGFRFSLHIPRPSKPSWATLTIYPTEIKDPISHISFTNLTITFCFFPLYFRSTRGSWLSIRFDDFALRVYHSSRTPSWVQALRDNIIRTVLTGDILRLNRLKTTVVFDATSSSRAQKTTSTRRIYDTSRSNGNIHGQVGDDIDDGQDQVVADLRDDPLNRKSVSSGIGDDDSSGSTTEESSSLNSSPWHSQSSSWSSSYSVSSCPSTPIHTKDKKDREEDNDNDSGVRVSGNEAPDTEEPEKETETRISISSDQWIVRNWSSRMYNLAKVDAQLRQFWSKDHCSLAIVSEGCNWVSVPPAHATAGSSLVSIAWEILLFPTTFLKLLWNPMKVSDLYIGRIDINFDDFRLQDTELFLQVGERVRLEWMKNSKTLSGVGWDVFCAAVDMWLS